MYLPQEIIKLKRNGGVVAGSRYSSSLCKGITDQ